MTSDFECPAAQINESIDVNASLTRRLGTHDSWDPLVKKMWHRIRLIGG